MHWLIVSPSLSYYFSLILNVLWIQTYVSYFEKFFIMGILFAQYIVFYLYFASAFNPFHLIFCFNIFVNLKISALFLKCKFGTNFSFLKEARGYQLTREGISKQLSFHSILFYGVLETNALRWSFLVTILGCEILIDPEQPLFCHSLLYLCTSYGLQWASSHDIALIISETHL